MEIGGGGLSPRLVEITSEIGWKFKQIIDKLTWSLLFLFLYVHVTDVAINSLRYMDCFGLFHYNFVARLISTIHKKS